MSSGPPAAFRAATQAINSGSWESYKVHDVIFLDRLNFHVGTKLRVNSRLACRKNDHFPAKYSPK
jgi:hypothetical protein